MKWIIIIVVVLVILVVVKFKKKNKRNIKGEIGEIKVKYILNSLPKKYRIINDVMISSNKNYSQIDHIVISPKGIIVIETKNYSGIIYGKEEDYYWTQILRGSKNKFYNPIKQNQSHIRALTQCIEEEFGNIPIFSIVVFVGNAKLKRIKTKNNVIYLKKLKSRVKHVKGRRVLNKNDIKELYRYIDKINISNKNIRKKHVKYINKNFN